MELKHHKTLTKEKWAVFPLPKQLLMIANELNRSGNMIKINNQTEVKKCYERAMELLYLTVCARLKGNILRELLRFSEVLGGLYVNETPGYDENQKVLGVLLAMNRESFNALHAR